MKDLFKAELLRFRVWALAAAFVHLLVLGFLARLVDLAQQPLLVYRVFGGTYALAGLLFGLYQMGSYRRPSAWLNLLHRPLPPARIAAALCGAGALWLAVAVAVPVLAIALYQHGMTARVVDLRHWLLVPAGWSLALAGYLAGAVAMLANRRWSACGLVLLAWLGVAEASGWAALAVQALALLWLAGLLRLAFKPDLAEPPRGAGIVLAAVPVQMGVYLLLLLLGFGMEMVWIMQGSHPLNAATPPPGGHVETDRMDGRQRLLAGLGASTAPQAALWREQVALSKAYALGAQLPWRLERGTLTNRLPAEFDDAHRHVRWVFSHDRMRFEGYGTLDGRRVGAFGVGPRDDAFPAPAVAAGTLPGLDEGDATLIAGNTLYRYASDDGRAWPRIVLPAGEWLLGVTPVGEALMAVSDRAVYVFDGRAFERGGTPVAPRMRLAVPGRSGDLSNIDVVELVDGYLFSFSFTAKAGDARGVPPYQRVLWLHDDGRVTAVARRALRDDYPATYRYAAWWPSPAMHALRQAATRLFARPDPVQATAPPPVPRGIQALAGTLMALSLLAALWLSRRLALSREGRLGWIVACGAVGLPALAALWLMVPPRESPEAAA